MLMTSSDNFIVWGVFVGDKGNQLEIFNSKMGPFPPEPDSEGMIPIGWPATGDLTRFQNNYPDYVEKFRVVYPNESEMVLKTQANMLWNFCFTMNIGDWIISPSSFLGLLLVGIIIGEYKSDFHDETGLYGFKRVDFVHTRKVQWKYIIKKSDPRYSVLNRIGLLTVSRQNLSPNDLKKILEGAPAE
jgi:hypothetical protein